MKNFFCLATIIVMLVSCAGVTEKEPLTEDEKKAAEKDVANYTTIEWLDSTVRDFGKIKEGQVLEVTYRFRNSGNKNLVITNVSASCGCTVPEKPEKPFAPGEEGTIRAKFDSRGRVGISRKDVYVSANTTPERSMRLSFAVEVTQ